VLELNCGLPFDLACADDFFNHAPAATRRLLDRTGEMKLPSRCSSARKICAAVCSACLGPPDPTSKRLNLREVARGIGYRLTGSRFEQIFTYYLHAKQHFPKRYPNMLRLRPPAVLKVEPAQRVSALLRHPPHRCR